MEDWAVRRVMPGRGSVKLSGKITCSAVGDVFNQIVLFGGQFHLAACMSPESHLKHTYVAPAGCYSNFFQIGLSPAVSDSLWPNAIDHSVCITPCDSPYEGMKNCSKQVEMV